MQFQTMHGPLGLTKSQLLQYIYKQALGEINHHVLSRYVSSDLGLQVHVVALAPRYRNGLEKALSLNG